MTEESVETGEIPLVLQDLRGFLQRDGPFTSSLFDKSVMATPVAAIKALLGVVHRSKATTMMELQDELKQARAIMIKAISDKANQLRFSILPILTRNFLDFSL